MMNLLNPIDVSSLKKQMETIEPFPHFCIDNFLNEQFAEEVHDAFPSFTHAQSIGREFSALNEKKKVQITNVEKFPEPIKKLNSLLSSPEFLEMCSEITGIPDLIYDHDLRGGGIHETNTGGRLDVHIDFNYVKDKNVHRRLNILIYFNKDWKEEYGGFLDLWDVDVKKRYGYFAPKFNRACGFVTSDISYHGVTPIKCPQGITRKSFATYYYTKQAPEGWDGKFHSTVFKARPTEYIKGNVLMPLHSSIKAIKQKLSNLKNLL